MPEISSHEYELLCKAIEASSTSMTSINLQLNGLAVRLAEHYMPRSEDIADDESREKRLYARIDEVAEDMNTKVKILQWVIGIQFTLTLALLGLEHFK